MDPNMKCCVLGCHTKPNRGIRFYRFPCHNPQISLIWEQRISESANIDFDILNDHVCELHFDYRCKTGNECALEEGSLPTLNLPSFGTISSTENAHFQTSANRIEEPSHTISIDSISYHCRFCLRRGLLYEVEASTYRKKSFLSLIDLPPDVFPDNSQPNACLTCLKSIVIGHQLSVAVVHSNTILQQLLQHPKQNKMVPKTSFFDIKSELAFCNLIPANSLSIKLEIDDNMVWANENCEQKWVGAGEPTSLALYVNSQSIAENEDVVSKMLDSVSSDKQCLHEFQKSFAIAAQYTTDRSAEGIPKMENDDNAEVMVSNNSDDPFAEDRQLNNELASESTSMASNELTWQTTFTAKDESTHWNDNDDVYVCPICDWKISSLYSFNAHMSKHVESDKNDTTELQELETDPVRNADGGYQCSQIPKAFDQMRNFGQHKKMLTNEKPYKCTECSKAFSCKSGFNIHMKIHTNERPYKCNECLKTFSLKHHLSQHKRTHTDERPYKCNECSKTFSQKSGLNVHKITHTNERPYKCTDCPKTFSRKSGFNVHRRIHTNEKPYKCSECSKTFSQIGNFFRHKRIHTNDRPYKCTECPKTFITKSCFHTHKRIHTNERPHKCTECPKTFITKRNLDLHKKIHKNEKPNKCSECPKTFSQKGSLNIHKRTHTNERPYKCSECAKTFSQKGSLDLHKRTHTNERPYKCQLCPSAFNLLQTLKRHVLSKHSDLKT